MVDQDALRRMIEDNRQARERTTNKLSRLAEALQQSDPEKFHETVADILETDRPDSEDGEVSGSTGATEPLGGSPGDAADEMGGEQPPQES